MLKRCGLCLNEFVTDDERIMVCEDCGNQIVEESNTPDFDCGHCGQQTRYMVEFRDLGSDEPTKLRSLCNDCATKILEWV